MKRIIFYTGLILWITLITSCNTAPVPSASTAVDPLPSWNQTATKQAIVDFVTNSTAQGNPKFIPQDARIAVFDNDGTLWCEQPLYFEMTFSIDATAKIAVENKALQKKPEIKALAQGDIKTFMKSGEKAILEAFAVSHTAVKPDKFDEMTKAWLATEHPRFKKPYGSLTYKPMTELLSYLRDNGFKTYIVSGGSNIFMRNFSWEAYGIPPEQVIGTMFKAAYIESDRAMTLKPEVWHMDDNAGKPEAIFQIIGRKPVIAFGNSDGDQQMLQWTSTNTLPNMSLLLHHTDSIREYAYDRNSHIGKLDKALNEATEKGWIVVDMQKDFNKVFSFE